MKWPPTGLQDLESVKKKEVEFICDAAQVHVDLQTGKVETRVDRVNHFRYFPGSPAIEPLFAFLNMPPSGSKTDCVCIHA